MTKRERHLRILDGFGGLQGIPMRHLDHIIAVHGLVLFTDEAIELLTKHTIVNWRRTQRMNADNRKLAKAA
jgi:hypothetical protein